MGKKNRGSKKKAAVITWCNNGGGTNYGQILQCYAVQKIFERQGYEVLVILYQKEEYLVLEKTERGRKFNRFIENSIHCSAPCYTKTGIERETEDAEILVCGSDQIWNPICFDPIYFLDFGTSAQRRIAFAASGIFEDKPEYREIYRQMAKLIEGFEKVSVREQIGADILARYTKKEISVMPDPTLQLSKDEWDGIESGRIVEGDYVFCYMLGRLSPHQMIIREVKKKHKVNKIIYIPSNLTHEGNMPMFYAVEDAGPAEFVSLIKYAKAVCTDSFHGTALSIVYNQPFYVMPRLEEGKNSYCSMVRMENLLRERRMESRIVRNVKEVRNIR